MLSTLQGLTGVSDDRVSPLEPNKECNAFLKMQTNLSQVPPKCAAPGGLNFQIIPW